MMLAVLGILTILLIAAVLTLLYDAHTYWAPGEAPEPLELPHLRRGAGHNEVIDAVWVAGTLSQPRIVRGTPLIVPEEED